MATFPEEKSELEALPTAGGEKKFAAGLALCLSNLEKVLLLSVVRRGWGLEVNLEACSLDFDGLCSVL